MSFPELTFCYPWRPYQKRVLDAVDQHLGDRRLHVVAAPGAGKTTLGLEVFRRLGKPALALSPTRVIRDQWILRLKDFCETEDPLQLDWVSNDLREPRLFTSITYQALHAGFYEELNPEEEAEAEVESGLAGEEVNAFIRLIRENGVEVLILDEAHHLRAEWWRALEKVCEAFPELTLVALTATPPYDSLGKEWGRYEKLCGPIDEEISVPELVKAGTLCPHQDFIWASNVSENEKRQIQEYDQRVGDLCDSLFREAEFCRRVQAHPWLHREDVENEVLKEPETAMVLLSFLKAKAGEFPEPLMRMLDLHPQDIPDLGRHGWQVLVEHFLFSASVEHDEAGKDYVKLLKKQLRASELLHKRELSLERSRRLERSLSLSTSKIDSILAVHELELAARGEELRQVVLTDYIRDEFLQSGVDTGELNLGAWPVFSLLSTDSPVAEYIGMVTGRRSILPEALLPAFRSKVDENRIRVDTLPGWSRYRVVSGPLNQLTPAFTALLMEGKLRVLVGTRSLLGEGWDAPPVNSLILASTVGSFMLTNQMRGRAIRVDRQRPEKIASIWHLVALNSKSPSGWRDAYNLSRRFETFVGLSAKEATIESGFERMHARHLSSELPQTHLYPAKANNRQMIHRYRKLQAVGERWQEALALGGNARVLPSVKSDELPRVRQLELKHCLRYLLVQLSLVLFQSLQMFHFSSLRNAMQVLTVIIGLVLLFTLPKTFKILQVLFRYLPVDGALKQIGRALAEALCRAGFVETSIRRLQVKVSRETDGSFSLALAGGSFYESSLFADCLAEILGPIDRPRYLLIREGKFMGMQREDFHAVPARFGTHKENAMILYKAWCKHVSLTELIYTRSPEGRKRLLRARMKSFSAAFHHEVKRQDKWQA